MVQLIILLTIFIGGLLVYYFSSKEGTIHNSGTLIDNETDTYINNYYGYDIGKSKTEYGEYIAEPGETTNYVEDDVIVRDMKNKKISDIKESSGDGNTFIYGKKKYKLGSIAEIKKKYNPNNLLPKEKNEDWFDTEFLMDYDNILNETQLIHPTKFMDQNTVLGSRKGMSYDIRGDIPNPKVYRPIFGETTIEPAIERNGLCNY
jgi:hypothetical protein